MVAEGVGSFSTNPQRALVQNQSRTIIINHEQLIKTSVTIRYKRSDETEYREIITKPLSNGAKYTIFGLEPYVQYDIEYEY